VIKESKVFSKLTHSSKNLYNYANYLIRKHFIESGELMNEYLLSKALAKFNQGDYRAMPTAQSAQQVIKLLFKNWKSFFKAIADWRVNPEKYLGRPRIPKYKKKNGHNIVIFTNQNIRVKDGYIHFPKKSGVKPLKSEASKIKQVRVIPQATCFIVEVVYEKESKRVELSENSYLSIDLGLDNLATIFNNIGKQPFIINGKPIKSINQFYNKQKAKLMSFVGDRGTSNRIEQISHKRDMKIDDYLHKASRQIVNYSIYHKIGTIIIGDNENWKQNIEIGKKNNQNFVSIPHKKFVQMIQYKAEEVGIEVILTEESYTSKVDHLSDEPLGKQKKYLGKRVKRGLFKSFTDKFLNADINGAIGIMRKVVPEVVRQTLGDRGTVFVPYKISF
jgi:putative transposase